MLRMRILAWRSSSETNMLTIAAEATPLPTPLQNVSQVTARVASALQTFFGLTGVSSARSPFSSIPSTIPNRLRALIPSSLSRISSCLSLMLRGRSGCTRKSSTGSKRPLGERTTSSIGRVATSMSSLRRRMGGGGAGRVTSAWPWNSCVDTFRESEGVGDGERCGVMKLVTVESEGGDSARVVSVIRG